MSAGPFVITRYEANDANVYPITLQQETLELVIGAATNDPPAGPVTSEITAYARKPATRYGVGARNVRIAWTDPANPPAGYRPFTSLLVPILTPALFDALVVGDTGTYLATGVTVTSKLPERVT